MDKLRKEIMRYALENAVTHDGKAAMGPVMSKVMGAHPELRNKAREVAALVKEVVDEVNSMSLEEQKRLLEELGGPIKREKRERKGLPPLPDASEGSVVTRFAPNPDFYIHLGNARPAILSHEYARMYKGKFILRFEHTDPRVKRPDPDAYAAIREDLRWLGVKWDEEYIQSLRMETYYRIAKELIRRGCLYVDFCSREEFRRYRDAGKACPHRDSPPEDVLEEFEKAIAGYYGEGEVVVRVKTDLKHPNPSVRDWVAFRVVDTDKHPHPITGSRYVLWPTYNFAAGVDDHLMGVTHILRGQEHSVNTIKQGFIYSCMGWEYPKVINLGRLHLEGLVLSKSTIKSLMRERPSEYLGPDDPRFGTIAALRRRGILAETLREVILSVGIKHSDARVSWDNIASLNRKLIDPKARRFMVVVNPVRLRLEGLPEELRSIELAYHPDNEALGRRTIELDTESSVLVEKEDAIVGSAIRLYGLANVKVERDEEGLMATFLGSSVREARAAGMRIVHWVPASSKVIVEMLEASGDSLRHISGVGEQSLSSVRPGEIVQFMRHGFYRIDSVKVFANKVVVTAIFAHD